MSEEVRGYSSSIPRFLIGRSTFVLKHCLARLLSDDIIDKTKVTEMSGQKFIVHEGMFTNEHPVDLSKPSCNCEDFQLHGLPCKHILLVLKKLGLDWDALGSEFRDLPHFNINNCAKDVAPEIANESKEKDDEARGVQPDTAESQQSTSALRQFMRKIEEARRVAYHCQSSDNLNVACTSMDEVLTNLNAGVPQNSSLPSKIGKDTFDNLHLTD